MRRMSAGIVMVVATLAAAGCASDERQWLKLSGKYTTEEFRRDHAACSKGGSLDDACMRGRGWVAVNPSGKAEQAKDPLAREIGAPARPSGRY
jgi:hypothetical protein